MRIASLIARYLLGLIFLVFGLNGFLHFLPGPIPPGVAGQFLTALIESHYVVVIFLLQLIPGILLLVNFYVPLALTLLAPVIANIFFFHLLMAPSGLPMAILVIVLWSLVFYSARGAFAGIFARRT
ncbi:hypothetical protein [Nevskia soli]|jgi:hypothetical protein|uniref:hypothetical protein n=1 Tax=Nevskia soli TaxID=418856 RepID=UPI0015D8CFB1|nr:hypothetical protein [Nevskia soli]